MFINKIIRKIRTKIRYKNKEIIFIIGTDTGVGKTYSTINLIQKDFEKGIRVSAIKPLETGLDTFPDYEGSDSLQYAKLLKKSIEEVNLYFFTKPIAPAAAAVRDSKIVDIDKIKMFIEKHRMNCDKLYIEGAGGMLVPINGKYTFLNLIREYKKTAKVIIVAKNSLGTINHTLMTVEILKINSVEIEGIILNNVDNTTDKLFMTENKETIEQLSGVKVIMELEYQI